MFFLEYTFFIAQMVGKQSTIGHSKIDQKVMNHESYDCELMIPYRGEAKWKVSTGSLNFHQKWRLFGKRVDDKDVYHIFMIIYAAQFILYNMVWISLADAVERNSFFIDIVFWHYTFTWPLTKASLPKIIIKRKLISYVCKTSLTHVGTTDV